MRHKRTARLLVGHRVVPLLLCLGMGLAYPGACHAPQAARAPASREGRRRSHGE